MKKAKKALALLLAVVMCVSLVSAIAYAEDDGDFTYGPGKTVDYDIVCIGDSTSIGYGLEDYGTDKGNPPTFKDGGLKGNNGTYAGLYTASSKGAFPYLLGDFAQKSLGAGYKVSSTNLGMEGMRFQELRSILDPTFKGDYYNKNGHLDQYKKIFSSNNLGDITQVYKQAIMGAECIVLDCLTSSFGTYLSARLTDTGNNYNETYADVVDSLVPGTSAAVESIVGNMLTQLGLDVEDSQVKDIADGIVYAYLEMCVNFDACIEMIRQINPLAKIIVVGTYNTMDGLYAKVGDLDVDFGGLWNTLVSLVNNYVTLLSSNRNQYFYADVSDGLQMYWQSLAECDDVEDAKEDCAEFAAYILKDSMGADKYALSQNPEMMKQMHDGGYLTDTDYAFLTYGPDYILYTYMLAADYTDLDFEGVFTELGGDYVTECKAFIEKCVAAGIEATLVGGNPYDTIDALFAQEIEENPGIAGILHVYVHFQVGMGLGAHPDATGCQEKFEAVRDAWLKVKTADKEDNDTVAGFWHNFGSTILNTFQAPLLDKINQIISNFIDSFIAFWTNLFGAVKQ